MVELEGAGGASSDPLEDLARTRSTRIELRDEIAKGGMGEVWTAWDPDLRRELAVKRIRSRDGVELPKEFVQRFVEEAQVTAQLDHPGVVAVHELGVDGEGEPYFAMTKVRGEELGRKFRLAAAVDQGWNRTRVIGVLLQVCETLAYAHAKGVIHRDLKPANVMVGAFGEVYVMDWGIAKVVGPAGSTSAPEDVSIGPAVQTVRAGEDVEDPALTLDGTIVGTPAYMSPEQAAGEVHALDARTDVYAVGAMLYEALTGSAPFSGPQGTPSSVEIVLALRQGAPQSIESLADDVPPELVAIAEKAMERDPEARYASTQAMAEDLRAFLEGRVVSSYRTGALVEFKKWVGRNRLSAAALGGVVLVALAGLGTTSYVQAEGKKVAQDERKVAEDRLAEAQALADTQLLDVLLEEEKQLWPVVPDMAPAIERWIEVAMGVIERKPDHEAFLGDLQSGDEALLARFSARAVLSDSIDQVTQRLVDRTDGLARFLPQVEERLVSARSLTERTLTGAEAREAWELALEDLRSLDAYEGVELEPQLGLLPLGVNEDSGLLEFWNVLTGARPPFDDATGARMTEESGVVLVLLPGGRFEMGERHAAASVELEPFFMSKFEVTISQWKRRYPRKFKAVDESTEPVYGISWHDAKQFTVRSALELPTEARWEYACQGGATGMYSFNGKPDQYANLSDITRLEVNELAGGVDKSLDDGFDRQAPVGSFRPNGYGLYDCHGNVWEWVLDDFAKAPGPPQGPAGLRVFLRLEAKGILKGGSSITGAKSSRSSWRQPWARRGLENDVGFRPCRSIDRPSEESSD